MRELFPSEEDCIESTNEEYKRDYPKTKKALPSVSNQPMRNINEEMYKTGLTNQGIESTNEEYKLSASISSLERSTCIESTNEEYKQRKGGVEMEFKSIESTNEEYKQSQRDGPKPSRLVSNQPMRNIDNGKMSCFHSL